MAPRLQIRLNSPTSPRMISPSRSPLSQWLAVLTVSLAVSASLIPLAQADLVGLWRFEGDAADSSDFGNHGALQGGASFSGSVPPGTGSTQSLDLAGGGQYLRVPHDASLNITSAITIAAWVNTSNSGWDGVLAKNPSAGSNSNHAGNYELRIESGGRHQTFLFEQGSPNSTTSVNTSGVSSVPTNVWSHLAFTGTKGGTYTFYLNGTAVRSGSLSSNFGVTNANPLYIGSRADLFTPMDGRLDDVAVFNEVLSQAQIQAIRSGDFSEFLPPGIELDPAEFVTSVSAGDPIGTLVTPDGDAGDTFSYSLVAGDGDADNAKFQIGGDQLEAGSFDFSNTPDFTEFSVRVRSVGAPSGEVVEAELTLSARADSDADGLLDAWEESWAGAGNLGVLSGLGGANADGDSLSDLEEYDLRGTFPNLDPTSADSDGDGLDDGDEIAGAGLRPPTDPTSADTDSDSLGDQVETNTGTFSGPTDTGTDPTVADTDGDTLNDGAETGTGVFIGPTDTGSDPNAADTDGDDFNDNVEVAGGSDPSDPGSVPPTPPVGLDRPASSPDAVVVFNEVNYNPAGAAEAGEWIELFNQMGIKTDVSGWRIDGVGYIFPEGTFIDPGDYLVVAKSPAPGQLGPFPGNLANGGERLRLINRGDRLMDELEYGDDGRWPAAADGSGASLAKRDPYSANLPAQNWTVSAQVGGTPGAENFPAGSPAVGLLINEMPAAGAADFWVELINAGPSAVALDGAILSAAGDAAREFTLSAGTLSAGARLLLDEATLGFRPGDGEKLFLYSAARAAVLDGRELTGRNRGRAAARGGAWLYPDTPTPGAPNTFSFHHDIVISEIAYNPPSTSPAAGNSDNQWIEIANRGTAPVDLTGWEFADGIGFEFSPGTTLAPGEHACIAREAGSFAAAFPGARLLGEFDGSLSRGGERLLLRDAAKNPVDELRYFDGGRWPDAADGGGSTLELRDLDADNAVAEAWAASDESAQTGWRTYTYRGTASPDGGPDGWKEFNIGLLDAGEILIDDVSVVEGPDGAATQLLSNADFESGSAGWRLRGNHRHSEVIADPDDAGNQVLRVVASSVTEHMHNQIETTLAGGRSIVNGRTYEISFRARWVTGTRLFHTRLYFSRLARAHVIDRPDHVGTPSAANSRAVANLGPTIDGVRHSPAVPAAGQAILVTASASDPDGVGALTLRYSVNGAAFQSTAMAPTADGGYQGTIPGQAAAAVVQFYVGADDGLGASSTFPAGGPDSRALIKVDDGLAATNGLHNFRIVLTDADRDLMFSNTEVMSNDRARGTIIDREQEIYYDVRVRLKGSQRARAYQPRVGFNLRFGPDQPYRGVHQSMAIDRSEGTGSGQFELLFDLMMANSGGVISRYYDLIQVITPTGSTHTRPAVLQMARYDDVFLNSQFEDGGDGNLFEYDFVYYPTRTDNGQPTGNKIPQNDGISGLSIANHGDDKERYRFYLLKKNNRDNDDFSPIIDYCKLMSRSGAAFSDTLDQVVDVDSWLRGMAYGVLSGAGDNTAAGTGHNGMYYARPDGRIVYLPHDMDFAFSNTRSIFANGECRKLANTSSNPGNAQRQRLYFGHLHDIISTTWNETYMGMWQTHLSQLSPGQNWTSPNSGSYTIGARSANVLSQIRGRIPEVSFTITTPSPLSVPSSTATVSGDGWVNVRQIRVAGAPEPLEVTWTGGDSWQVTLPVSPGQQSYTLQAFDYSGTLIGGDSITIENTTPVEPASAGNLAISEIMYHPAAPSPGELGAGFTDQDQFEFIELMNIGTAVVDLTGVAFTTGIAHQLPATTLAPGERKVIARDRAAFLSRYPASAGALMDGEYLGVGDSNQLSNGGEQIVLSDALGADIRRFSYSDDLPWPEAADGDGYSLTLIAPEDDPDHSLASNWRASVDPGGTPGGSDAVAFAGDPDLDGDGDGLSAFLEHAFGSSDSEPGLGATAYLDPAGHLVIAYPRNLAADDVVVEVQTSADLLNWETTAGDFALTAEAAQGDGTSQVMWRSLVPRALLREFVRLRARSR